MKKSALTCLLTVFLTLPAMAAENLIVSHVAGKPEIVRDGKAITAEMGMACMTGDILKTSTPECHIDLAINQLAGCRLLPSSECAIVNGSPEDMKLQVKNGNVILNLERLPEKSSFQVETPSAVAVVRGTQFWGRVDINNPNNPVTTFAVREGTVEVFSKSANRTFSLQAGQALDLPLDGSMPLIRPALEEEMRAMEQASAIKTSA